MRRRIHGEYITLPATVVVEWADALSAAPAAGYSAFPERNPTAPAEQQGIFRKFDVRRVDGSDAPGGKHHGCRYFVLDMDHDQHAPLALRAYAASCAESHPQLSADLNQEFGAAKRAVEAGGWRGIETAPKDEPIRLFDKNEMNADFNPSGSVEGMWLDDVGWVGASWRDTPDDWMLRPIKPTHWMPLPEPPK